MKRNLLRLTYALGLLFATTRCAQPASTRDQNLTTPTNNSAENPQTPPAAAPTPAPPDTAKYAYPLLWEAARPDSKAWSTFTFNVITDEAQLLIHGTKDIATFCPRYDTLSTHQRVNFWGLLFSAMTKYESGFDPLSRMRETTMGTDPITGKQVFSEGLLQLSYQDITGHRYCDFDWSKDKNLKSDSPLKTILDPYKNLNCGILIMNSQVRRYNRIAIGDGAYWAVIKTNSKYNKISQITALTKKMPGCTKEP